MKTVPSTIVLGMGAELQVLATFLVQIVLGMGLRASRLEAPCGGKAEVELLSPRSGYKLILLRGVYVYVII